MSRLSRLACLISLISCLMVLMGHKVTIAQAQSAVVVGYAALPAGTVTDGAPAGNAFAAQGAINGIRVPFDSQPLGSINALLSTNTAGSWLVLSSGSFDKASTSADYLLRIYVVELDLKRASGGSGDVSPVDWIALTDPRKLLGAKLTDTRTRRLTGADFSPLAVGRAADGSFWVAESLTPSLLRFDSAGKLRAAPIPLTGTLQAMAATTDRLNLVIALRQNNATTLAWLDLKVGAFSQQVDYPLTNGLQVGGMVMINATQALVIEQDGRDGFTGRKQVVLATFNVGANQVTKQTVVDLLKIADPDDLTNSGGVFAMPYAALHGIGIADAQTIVVVNNNRVPFSNVRQRGQADPTEYIAIRLAAALKLSN